MKKQRIEYIVDSFVNEKQETRYFVIAAISEMLDPEGIFVVDSYENDIQQVYKGLKIGYSICNPIDKFNEKLGIDIAIGRARKNSEYAILVSNPGTINSQLVTAFLKQEADYFKRNPEHYIAGYKREKL